VDRKYKKAIMFAENVILESYIHKFGIHCSSKKLFAKYRNIMAIIIIIIIIIILHPNRNTLTDKTIPFNRPDITFMNKNTKNTFR